MNLGVLFPQTEFGADPIAIKEYAQAAEGLGYESFERGSGEVNRVRSLLSAWAPQGVSFAHVGVRLLATAR